MRRAWRLALVLGATGCGYVQSAVHEVFDDERAEIRIPQGSPPLDRLPDGTVRRLEDPLFSNEVAELGFFDARAFANRAPLLLYTLAEPQDGRVPVVFVHGIRGSPRDFRRVVDELDLGRVQPWFFYYPSGARLTELSDAFYELVLSGRYLRSGRVPLVIIAHSMGGLIVREALNHETGTQEENAVSRLVTLASPMGGMATAGGAGNGPVVIRCWRDVNTGSPFLAALHRRPLQPGLEYHLLFAFANTGRLKVGENSDGVVALASQLDTKAQAEAKSRYGFNDTHAGVLHDPEAVDRILAIVDAVTISAHP